MARRSIVLLTAIIIAAVGVALIFVYVNRAQDRVTKGQDLVTVQITNAVIPVGMSLSDAVGKSDTAQVSALAVPIDQVVTADNVASASTLVAKADIPVGTPLRLDLFDTPGATVGSAQEITAEAIALQLGDPQRIASYLKPGIQVKLYVFDPDKNQATELLRTVKVLKVGSKGAPGTTVDPEVAPDLAPALVTLDTNASEAAQIITAQGRGNTFYMTALKSTPAAGQ